MPGSVQPHGVLLALEGPTHLVTQASANTLELLGLAAQTLLGHELAAVLGDELCSQVTKALAVCRTLPQERAVFSWQSPGVRPFTTYVHTSGPTTVLELLPSALQPLPSDDDREVEVRAFKLVHARTDVVAKCAEAARWVRQLTGYDRVMVYRFHDDWHGEVIAESLREGLEPYLGLHYPASDIPAQARALYVSSPTRMIVDVDHRPSPLVPPVSRRPLDLSGSMLRSVSPIHLEYLSNMGVKATLVASLLREGKLWGLISCQHTTALMPPRWVRQFVDCLAQDLSSQITAVEEVSARQRATALKRSRDSLIAAMREGARLPDLLHGPLLTDLLTAVGAEGAAFIHESTVTTGGITPQPSRILELSRALIARPTSGLHELFTTDCLSERLPELAELAELSATAAGVGMFPLDETQSMRLMWFRGERSRFVNWGGNPDKAASVGADGRMSPRKSFEAWTQSVHLRSLPWSEEERASARELGSMLDIELRRLAEDALKATSVLLRDVVDSLSAHIAVLDERGVIIAVNEAWRRFAEGNGGAGQCQPGASYLGVCSAAVASAEATDADTAMQGIREVLAGTRSTFSYEYPCDSPLEARWFLMHVYRLSGQRVGAVVAHENITVSKLAVATLAESEARFRQLFEANEAVMALLDPRDGSVVDANPAAARFYELPRERLRTMNLADFSPIAWSELVQRLQAAAAGRSNTFVSTHRLPSGGQRRVQLQTSPVKFGGRTLLFCIVYDVTEQVHAQQALEHERERYLKLMTIAQDGIHLIDEQGLLIEANDAFLTQLGYSREAIGTLTLNDWDAGLSPDELTSMLSRLISQPGLFQTRHRRRDGSIIEVEVNAGGVELEGKKYLLAASRDITVRSEFNRALEKKVATTVAELRAKDQLLVTQSRQAAMGEMIGNIAHQWRQPLNALGLLLMNLGDAHAHHELDEQAMRASVDQGNALVQKMSSTINDFRNFFRPDKERVVFSVKGQVEQTVALVEASFKHAGIELRLEADEAVKPFGPPNEFSQVMLNLLINARDAITATGVKAGLVQVAAHLQDERGVVTVRDNGGGIAPAVLERMFDPFFSTRPEGTGIGLYMSKTIVERSMGGRLEALNVEGGAEFIVSCALARATP